MEATITISKRSLHKRLVRAAQARALISMASVIPAIVILSLIPAAVANAGPWLGLIAFFGVPGVVSWMTTILLCKRMVLCPACRGSLWACGTGNFKARRMRVKDGVDCCPHCKTPIA